MTQKSHVKFEENLTCGLESDMRNLVIFTRSVKLGTFMGFFCPKEKMLKIYRGVMCNDTEE